MTNNIQFVLTLLLHKIWSINISQIGKLVYKKMTLKINLGLHKIAKMQILLINPQAENKINKNKIKWNKNGIYQNAKNATHKS